MGRQQVRATVSARVGGGEASLIPDRDRSNGWLLLVDETQQSHVNLADPTDLAFEYVRRIGYVIDLLPPGPLRVVHLGGGAMTLARYAAATRPRTQNLVVDNDGQLMELVRTHLPWPRQFRIRVRCGDAREALTGLRPGAADLIVLDVFARARTPGEMTSVETFTSTRAALAPTGTLVANIADTGNLTYARRYVAGMQVAFDRLLLCLEPAVRRGRRFGNIIVVAQPSSADPLDLPTLVRRCSCDPSPARVLHGDELATFIGDHSPFTDATATGSPTPPAAIL